MPHEQPGGLFLFSAEQVSTGSKADSAQS
jgi:hypothetical protein